jgi:hypothetical protein
MQEGQKQLMINVSHSKILVDDQPMLIQTSPLEIIDEKNSLA